MRVRLAFCGLTAVLLLATGRVFASPRSELIWEAPDPCPGRDEVRALVAVWLGQSADALDLRTVRVTARVRALGESFSLEMTLESRAGSAREEHSAKQCETLAKLVALKVALAVDPLAALDSVGPKPKSRSVSGRAPAPRRDVAVSMRASGGIAFGPLPGTGPAVSVAGGLGWQDLRIELGGGYWFPRSVTYDTLPSVGARVRMFSMTARACPKGSLQSIELLVCTGVEGGIVRGTGFGVADARTSDRPWVALVLGPALAIPLAEPLYLWLEADAGFGVILPSFRVQNLPRLYQPERGAAQAWAGVEARFQ